MTLELKYSCIKISTLFSHPKMNWFKEINKKNPKKIFRNQVVTSQIRKIAFSLVHKWLPKSDNHTKIIRGLAVFLLLPTIYAPHQSPSCTQWMSSSQLSIKVKLPTSQDYKNIQWLCYLYMHSKTWTFENGWQYFSHRWMLNTVCISNYVITDK